MKDPRDDPRNPASFEAVYKALHPEKINKKDNPPREKVSARWLLDALSSQFGKLSDKASELIYKESHKETEEIKRIAKEGLISSQAAIDIARTLLEKIER